MHKIEKLNETDYRLTCEDGTIILGKRWYEKKTGVYHCKLPKGNPSGREYVRESLFKNGIYEFETKTEHRTGLSSGGNRWKEYLTDDEKKTIEEHEKLIEESQKTIDEIKERAKKRVPTDSKQREIDRLNTEVEKLRELLASRGVDLTKLLKV